MSVKPALLAILALALISTACGPPDDPSGPWCAEGPLVIEFDADPGEVQYAHVHEAVLDLPGSHVHTATWRDQDTPTQVTTTIGFDGASYELDPLDQELVCTIGTDIPIHLTIETSDGALFVNEPIRWGPREIIQPTSPADAIEVGARMSADPNDPIWIDAPVATLWPDIAQPDDDAELVLEVSIRDSELYGILYYSSLEIIDEMTVIYHQTALLEWGTPPDP